MNLYLKILKENFLKAGVSKNALVLDVGCGSGDQVHYLRNIGYEAYGIDVEFKEGVHQLFLQKMGLIKLIEIGFKDRSSLESGDEYTWPEFDRLFDVITSCAVLEHVRNLEEFVASSKYALKQGGICIHYFPSKHAIVEPHIGVPFGGMLKKRLWIKVMCALGVCFESKRGKGEEAFLYMKNFTSYRNQSEIDMVFKNAGFVRIPSVGPLRCHEKMIYRMFSRIPFANYLFSVFRSRVVVYKKL